MKKKYLLGLVLTLGLMSGCSNVNSGASVVPSTPVSSEKTVASDAPAKSETSPPQKIVVADSNVPGKEVTFNIKIDKSALSSKKDIEINIYNDEQIKLTEKNSKSTPEVFKLKFDELKDSNVIKSTSVKSGERFSITFSGLSSDNCNTAMSRIEGSSASVQEYIDKLSWASTKMACIN